jgi:uncharacterized protein DUF4123
MTAPSTDREISVLQVRAWARTGGLYAIIDACDAASVPPRAQMLGDRGCVSLYKGRSEEELWAIAPYLFVVNEMTFDWITAELWATPWGFLARADASLDALRDHFRKFLTVKTPTGEQWYFRFYDPRVLKRYLDSCNATERKEFFGPASALAMTNPETYGVTVITSSGLPEPDTGVRSGTPRISLR